MSSDTVGDALSIFIICTPILISKFQFKNRCRSTLNIAMVELWDAHLLAHYSSFVLQFSQVVVNEVAIAKQTSKGTQNQK